jgi:putative ABC transport system substrate-binding protein
VKERPGDHHEAHPVGFVVSFVLALALLAVPLAPYAQQPAMPVIGLLLSSATPEGHAPFIAAFRQGLQAVGYVEGQNVALDYRWAEHHSERLPVLAADLVRRQVAVIAALSGLPVALPAKAATTTIPIVFVMGDDPVKAGLVTSLSRPGGNLTGVTTMSMGLAPKRLELLHELVPAATSMALLVNPTNPNAEAVASDLQAAARMLGLQMHLLHASSERHLERPPSPPWSNCEPAGS